MTEGAGGLFDFNATLPLMAIQIVLLMVVLTFIFYKPVSKVLDDRELYISGNLAQAIGQARTDAAKLIEQTNKELEAQKSTALAQLETQVDDLSQLIKEKLLGKEVVL